MSRNAMNKAQGHLDRLSYIARNLGLPSAEARDNYFAVRECYSKAPPNQQFVLLQLVKQADEIWDKLNRKPENNEAPPTSETPEASEALDGGDKDTDGDIES